VSGALIDTDVPEGFPTTPVSLVAFHGRQDGVFASMEAGVATWRRRLGCDPPQIAPHGASGQVTRSATSCRDGTEVVVYELAGMDHAGPVPPSTTRWPLPTPPSPPTTCSGSSSNSTHGGGERQSRGGGAVRARSTPLLHV
jgi:poly(3-hydroxybutyrate) depolymerase